MKTKFLKPTILVLFSILFYSCNTTNCNHQLENKSCYPNDSLPSQVITYSEMINMMDAYDNGAKKELNKYLKKVSKGKDSVSTKYSWYKLEDLKQYIAYVERISKEKDITLTGFRIIPSSYPKDHKNPKLRNRTTLIFTPTTVVNNKMDVAFEPLYSKKGEPTLVEDYLNLVRNNKLKNSSFSNEIYSDSLLSSSANRLRPSPPY